MLKGLGGYTLTASQNNLRGRGFQLRANMAGGGIPSATSGPSHAMASGSGGQGNRYEKDVLEGFVNYQSTQTLRNLQRDIYFSDPVSGQIVDIISSLPFSDFELGGMKDRGRLQKYENSIQAMQVPTLLPLLTRQHLVDGVHISSMNFDDDEKAFTSIMPHAPEFCDIIPLPFYGRDPLINLRMPKHLKELVRNKDPRIVEELKRFGEDFVKIAEDKGDAYPLDSKYTLYLPRIVFPTLPVGISYYRRIIPIWLYEKALLRGTIDLANRRQKSLLHLMIGDEEWLPNNDQLTSMAKLFIDADNDPVGAVVATRPAVSTSEVRGGADFWKVDEVEQYTTNMKLKGLGVPEGIFGDFTVTMAEGTISSFMEGLLEFRNNLTSRIFYQKMFPIIAYENGFKKPEQKQEMTSSDEVKKLRELLGAGEYVNIGRNGGFIITSDDEGHDEIINPADYDLPTMTWQKTLRPTSNKELLDNLNSLDQAGLPATIRALAGAAGVSVEKMLEGYDEDIQIRKQIDAYRKKRPKTPQELEAEAQNGGGGGGGGGAEESDEDPAAMFLDAMVASVERKMQGKRKKNRTFNSEVRDPDTGKVLSRKGKAVLSDKQNTRLAEAIGRVQDRLAAKQPKREPTKSFSYSSRKGK